MVFSRRMGLYDKITEVQRAVKKKKNHEGKTDVEPLTT